MKRKPLFDRVAVSTGSAPDEPPRRSLVYDVPLNGFVAQLVLPYDLSAKEAERLAALIATLVVEPRDDFGDDR